MSRIKQKLEHFFLGHFLYQFLDTLKAELIPSSSLLDIGCGYNPRIKCITQSVKYSLGLDAFAPSIEKAKKEATHSDFKLVDVIAELPNIASKSFEVVIALDLIEHLEKEKGYWLIEQMERIATKKVVIFTPNGFVPQTPYDNNPWQEHKSGWSFEEMKSYGFRMYGFGGYQKLRGERSSIKFKPRIFWKAVAFYSQLLTYRKPRKAYAILCIKDIM